MKGSAVVHGLKSLASRLHPQLPLGPKESQKLFVALTTSFQNELDHAYPRQANVEEPAQTIRQGRNSKSNGEATHLSSATLADRHLAAVLTNPLLALRDVGRAPVLSLNAVRATLTKDPAQDAVSLLEDYEEQGAATLAIAALCLQFHNRKIDSLSQPERKRFMSESAGGKRILMWLWRSESYRDVHFLRKDNSFRDDLVLLLAREGEEVFLINCLKENRSPFGPVSDSSSDASWKTSIFQATIEAKLLEHRYQSADAASDALFAFLGWKKTIDAKDRRTTPFGGAVMYLCAKLASNRVLREGTESTRYDKLLQSLLELRGKNGKSRLMYARLRSLHPKTPTPLPALLLLRSAFPASSSDEDCRELLANPATDGQRKSHARFLARIAAQLQRRNQSEDAEWTLSLGRRLYPTEAFPDNPARLRSIAETSPHRAEESENLALT